MKDTIRISIIKVSTLQYLDNEALVQALGEHLCWQEVPRETYYHLARVLPKGTMIVCDHRENHVDGALDVSIEAALSDYSQEKEKRRLRAAPAGAAKKTAKKAAKKALTAKQIKELEQLRKELGDV